MVSREAIFAALFARLAPLQGSPDGDGTVVTLSRTLKAWTDVAPADQPALFQSEGRQTAVTGNGLLTKWAFHAELAVYVHASTAGTLDVVERLNGVVDAVLAAIDREPGTGRQTLGGLVHDCRVQGDVETDEGRLGQQAVALIPIEIIANT
jgi:hypothetical protein